MTADTLKSLTDALTHEESLYKSHGDTAAAAKVAAEITADQKKLADSFDKIAVADGKAAMADATKAAAAFGKGQFGPAAKYAQAEVKNLTAAKAELEKAIAVAPAADRAAYREAARRGHEGTSELEGCRLVD